MEIGGRVYGGKEEGTEGGTMPTTRCNKLKTENQVVCSIMNLSRPICLLGIGRREELSRS